MFHSEVPALENEYFATKPTLPELSEVPVVMELRMEAYNRAMKAWNERWNGVVR